MWVVMMKEIWKKLFFRYSKTKDRQDERIRHVDRQALIYREENEKLKKELNLLRVKRIDFFLSNRKISSIINFQRKNLLVSMNVNVNKKSNWNLYVRIVEMSMKRKWIRQCRWMFQHHENTDDTSWQHRDIHHRPSHHHEKCRLIIKMVTERNLI